MIEDRNWLRNGPRYNSEPEIWCLNTRSEVLAVGNVEYGYACCVPGAAAQHSFSAHLVMIPIVVINVGMFPRAVEMEESFAWR